MTTETELQRKLTESKTLIKNLKATIALQKKQIFDLSSKKFDDIISTLHKKIHMVNSCSEVLTDKLLDKSEEIIQTACHNLSVDLQGYADDLIELVKNYTSIKDY